MLRAGVISWLVLATLVGPWLCCCNTARIENLLQSLSDSPVNHQSRCCHPHNEQPVTDGDQPDPAKPCPCRDHTPEAGQVEPVSAEVLRQLDRGLPALAILVSFATPVLLDCKANFVCHDHHSAFPHLSCRDILCALQSFIC